MLISVLEKLDSLFLSINIFDYYVDNILLINAMNIAENKIDFLSPWRVIM